MIDSQTAKQTAKKYKVPTPDSGEFVKLPSIEVLHYWLEQNNLEIVSVGWDNEYMVVRKRAESPMKIVDSPV